MVSYFNGGLQLLCFCRGSQASCASCGLVSPKGVWCIWLSYSGGLSCGCPLFGFLLHAQISSYLRWALAFPVNWLIHWVFAYVSMWTGVHFPVPDSLCNELFISLPGASLNLQLLIYNASSSNLYHISLNIKKMSKSENQAKFYSWYGGNSSHFVNICLCESSSSCEKHCG